VRLYDEVLDDMRIDEWVDDPPELANELFMIWESEKENQVDGEFEEEPDHAL